MPTVEEEARLVGKVEGAIVGFGSRIDAITKAVTDGISDRDTIKLRLKNLEDAMDNLPARVEEIEKYGSSHTLKLEPLVQKLIQQVEALEKAPKKKRKKEQRERERIEQRQNLRLGLAGLLLVVFQIVVAVLSIYLAHH